MRSVLKIVLGVSLIVVAVLLFVITTGVAFVWKLVASVVFENRKAVDILSATSDYFIGIAASFDQLANFSFGGFFNWLFIKDMKKTHIKFGDKDETISEVLGWNKMLNNQTSAAKKLVCLLDYLDPNHCRLAMQSGIDKTAQKHQLNQELWRAL